MAKQEIVISHWYQLIEAFQASPLAFYEALEVAIKKRQVPDLETTRIDFKEGGLHTANREYLRIVRGKYAFEVCGSPFGTGFFFSWWFTKMPATYGILYVVGLFIGLALLMYM